MIITGKNKTKKTKTVFVKRVEITDARQCQVYLHYDVKWDNNGKASPILLSPFQQRTAWPHSQVHLQVQLYILTDVKRNGHQLNDPHLNVLFQFVLCGYQQSMNYRLLVSSGWALLVSTMEVREEKKSRGIFLSSCVAHKNDLLPIWQPKPIIWIPPSPTLWLL